MLCFVRFVVLNTSKLSLSARLKAVFCLKSRRLGARRVKKKCLQRNNRKLSANESATVKKYLTVPDHNYHDFFFCFVNTEFLCFVFLFKVPRYKYFKNH